MEIPPLTLAEIGAYAPPVDDWQKLLAGTRAVEMSMRVSLGDIALITGVGFALWCIRAVELEQADVRHAVIAGCVLPAARRASVSAKDARVHDCISALALWCGGDETGGLEAAAEAARDAAEASRNDFGVADACRAAAYAAAAAVCAQAVSLVSRHDTGWRSSTAVFATDACMAAFVAAESPNAERNAQRADIIAAAPLLVLKKDAAT